MGSFWKQSLNLSVGRIRENWLGRLAYGPQYALRYRNFVRKSKRDRLIRSSSQLREISNMQSLNPNHVLDLFRDFKDELERLREVRRYRHLLGPGEYDDFEGAILYVMTRSYQPKIIFECSPGYGYSSLYILSALEANGFGRLISFENSHARVMQAQTMTSSLGYDSIVEFIEGDARAEVPKMMKKCAPDLLFIDCDHSYEFGKWYTESLLPDLKVDTVIQIHDIQAFDSEEEKAVLEFLRRSERRYLYLWCYYLFNCPSFMSNLRMVWKAPLRHIYDGDSPALWLLPPD